MAGLVASDATLFEHGGKWWMLATVRDHGGPFSDALHAWSAPDITGPWQPHRHNPLMVDIASARPAGRVVRRNGKLIRPVQDCRDGYGAALGIAEILRLDDDGFAQRVETVLRPGRCGRAAACTRSIAPGGSNASTARPGRCGSDSRMSRKSGNRFPTRTCATQETLDRCCLTPAQHA